MENGLIDSSIKQLEIPLLAQTCEWDEDSGKAAFWPVYSDYGIFDKNTHQQFGEDSARNQVYRTAIQKYAPGSIAADIGTGPNLLWAITCAKFGASHVYAFERDRESYLAALKTLKESEFRKKISLYHTPLDSPMPKIGRQVDLCVSELVGEIASSEGMVAGLKQVQEEFLHPNARMIPERVATPVSAVGIPPYLREDPGFASESLPYLHKIFSQRGHPFDVRVNIDPFPEQFQFLTEPTLFEDFDYSNGSHPTLPIATPLSLPIQADGLFDGFLFWVKLWGLKSEPALDSLNTFTNWAPVFFPVFHPPLPVKKGWRIEAVASASISSDNEHPDYFIEGHISGPPDPIQFRFESWHSKSGHYRTDEFYKRLFPLPSSS